MAETKRIISPGAEKHLGVEYKVLDKGYVKLVEYMGADVTVVAAARHSYDKRADESDVAGNSKLINYLVKHNHSSPLEQPALVFEIKAPIFVFRQWHRHRMAKLNEMSGRYTELPDDYYVPSHSSVRAQSKTNKQGSGEELPFENVATFRESVDYVSRIAFAEYQLALELGVAREKARILLPVNYYSKMVWQMDLSNLLKFIKLRSHYTAQEEIREYSDRIALIISDAFPLVWAAKQKAEHGTE